MRIANRTPSEDIQELDPRIRDLFTRPGISSDNLATLHRRIKEVRDVGGYIEYNQRVD